MIKRNFRHIKSQKGQSMVEFALTLPVLLLVLCGILDFGWIFSNKLIVGYCAREGARYGSINASQQNAQALTQQRVKAVAPSFMSSALAVNVSFTTTPGDVIVDVSYPCDTLTPIGGVFTKNQKVVVEQKCEMKVE